jgi:hypothetical protein
LGQYLRPVFQSYRLARIDVLAVRTWLAKLVPLQARFALFE